MLRQHFDAEFETANPFALDKSAQFMHIALVLFKQVRTMNHHPIILRYISGSDSFWGIYLVEHTKQSNHEAHV